MIVCDRVLRQLVDAKSLFAFGCQQLEMGQGRAAPIAPGELLRKFAS